MSFKFKSVLVVCMFALLGSCSNNADNKSQTSDTDTNNITCIDSLLVENLNYNMDLSKLNYEQLRLLHNYPYAKHAFWFKEYDINGCYSKQKWYSDLINKTYYHEVKFTNYDGKEDSYQELNELDKNYWNQWDNNYEALKKKTELTEEERQFIARVDARMAELEKGKYVKVEGFDLYNPDMIVNWSINMGNDEKVRNKIQKFGFALQPSDYAQLFSIYEENDYNMFPSFVTTDLLLQMFYLYNKYVMNSLEDNTFVPAIEKMCNGLYQRSKAIADTATNADIKEWADFATTYYAIGCKLISGKDVEVPANMQRIYQKELESINAEEDTEPVLIQGGFNFPYSQFKPRAQYTRSEKSKCYFRAMMWLQLVYLCPDEIPSMQKALFMAKVLKDSPAEIQKSAKTVFEPLNYLMGEPNNIPILDLADMLKELGIRSYDNISDRQLVMNIKDKVKAKYQDKNCIKPKIQNTCQPKMNLMPQRYVPDADVLNMMADSVANAEKAYPRGVDVFDAFGIKAAKALNDTFYTDNKAWKEYNYYRQKASKKFGNFTDWNKTIYNKWMEILVKMQHPEKQYPGFMQTSGWQLRNLNSALASWAELKHNSVLYAVEPNGAECGDGGDDHLPDPEITGYVEPNLLFWQTLRDAVIRTEKAAYQAGYKTPAGWKEDFALKGKTESFVSMIDFCIKISKKELNHQKLTSGEKEEIRTLGSTAEYISIGLMDYSHEIGYVWNLDEAEKRLPVCASVYSRSIEGCDKNGQFHVGTGNANIIYVITEIDGYFYITRGATLSYYECVRPVGERLTDKEWQNLFKTRKNPNPQKWIVPFLLDEKRREDNDCNIDFIYSTGC